MAITPLVKCKRISTFSLFNFAFGLSYVSATFLPFRKLLLALMDQFFAISSLDFSQSVSVQVLFSYLIPTIIIFFFFRLTKYGAKLRTSSASRWLIGTANGIAITYLAIKIFAATIEGGGASFVVATFSYLVITPLYIMYLVGFLKVRFDRDTSEDIKSADRLNVKDEVFLVMAAIVSVGIFTTLPLEKMYAVRSTYNDLCEKGHTKIFYKVPPARSVAILKDRFSVSSTTQRTGWEPVSIFLLNQSLLESIERPATRNTLNENDPVDSGLYEKVSVVGEKVLQSQRGEPTTIYQYDAAPKLTSEYIVNPIEIEIPRGEELKLGGSKIEIRRAADNLLIAETEYYWNIKEHTVCPAKTRNGMFAYGFITKSLNVVNPKTTFEVEYKELSFGKSILARMLLPAGTY